MNTAQRIYEKIKRGADCGFLFWFGVGGRAEYVEKTIEYHFPDGSSIIRRNVDSQNETVTASWPKERPISSALKTPRSS